MWRAFRHAIYGFSPGKPQRVARFEQLRQPVGGRTGHAFGRPRPAGGRGWHDQRFAQTVLLLETTEKLVIEENFVVESDAHVFTSPRLVR